jgi:16S rRNA C967 or C1407 C5-methylase (RsmB/RsmF family)
MSKKNSPTSGPLRGADGFHAHYGALFGDEWVELYSALCKPPRKVALLNPFGDPTATRPILNAGSLLQLDALQCVDGVSDLQPQVDSRGLLSHYFLDVASVQAVAGLSGSRILDLCAAPGGKALAMIFSNPTAELFFLNDLSAVRADRLRKIMQLYLPADLQSKIKYGRKEGALLFRSLRERFDLVLVDAPCSGERHLIARAEELSHWSLQRGRRLSHRQVALLCSGAELLLPGGILLYSTCSINTMENDEVVDRLLEKWPGELSLEQKHWLLPQQNNNIGPIFYARIRRTQEV